MVCFYHDLILQTTLLFSLLFLFKFIACLHFHNFCLWYLCCVWGFVGGECAYCSSVQKAGPTCAGHLVRSSLLLVLVMHCHPSPSMRKCAQSAAVTVRCPNRILATVHPKFTVLASHRCSRMPQPARPNVTSSRRVVSVGDLQSPVRWGPCPFVFVVGFCSP